MNRMQTWAFLWDLGHSRRLASIFLLRLPSYLSHERQPLRDYTHALLPAIEQTFADLGLPDPAIARVLAYYGTLDDCNWSLADVQYVEEVHLLRSGALIEVD